jgi:hypothetical protein
MFRHVVHLRGVDNVTASCPPSWMDGESTVEMIGENMIHSSPANQDIFESASRVKETVRFAMLQSGNPQLGFELLEMVALIYGYVGSCIRCSISDVDRRASSSSAAAAAAPQHCHDVHTV